jgi:hypothetical protein
MDFPLQYLNYIYFLATSVLPLDDVWPFSNINLECKFSVCSVSYTFGKVNDIVFGILEIQT